MITMTIATIISNDETDDNDDSNNNDNATTSDRVSWLRVREGIYT